MEVRTTEQLSDLDGLVIPGGESTTMSRAIERDGLEAPIRAHAEDGRPVLGTCAGMIMLDRDHLGLMDTVARRNAFGRQLPFLRGRSRGRGIGPDPVRAVFIRAPWIEEAGPDVDVLASATTAIQWRAGGTLLACAFHPELTDDSRLHALFMAMATAAREQGRARAVRTRASPRWRASWSATRPRSSAAMRA